ncbi:MAG TPA: metallophosphoesterase [Bryobacteraceae bacterium]|nr:metallophosphoesterase [Bryobacteraceae bacterium]
MRTTFLTLILLLQLAVPGRTQPTNNFGTIMEWTNGLLPHYTCGAPGEPSCITGCADAPGNQIRIDPFTAQANCNLPDPVCTIAFGNALVRNPHDITFLVMTDVHLRNGTSSQITDVQHALHTLNMRQIGHNGWHWTQSNAGFPDDPIAPPVGLVSTGDETNDGQATSLGAFRLLYEFGFSTDAVQIPFFPGYGNHDIQNDCIFGSCGYRMLDYSQKAAACAPNIDPQSHNYSWDWGKYHMVQLNVWAGDTLAGVNNSYSPAVTDTHGSGLPWLIADLATHVGNSGRPVIIFQHYGWDAFSQNGQWWSDADRQSFLNVIKDYNVPMILSGHDHYLGSYKVQVTDSHGNLKTIDDTVGGTGGSGGQGNFFVVRLTDQFVDILPVEWLDPLVHFGSVSPFVVGVGNGGRPPFFNDVQGCRRWVGGQLGSAPLDVASSGQQSFTITNNTKGVLQGPFALRFNSLTYGSNPALPGQIQFTESCSAGPLYVVGTKSSLAPGESDTIRLSTYEPTVSGVVTLSGDYLQATPNAVSFSYPYSDSQTLNIASAFGAKVPISIAADQPWINAGLDLSTTPASMKVAINFSKLNASQSGTITISSSNSAYPSIPVTVTLAGIPVTFTSTAPKAVVAIDGTNYNLPVTLNLPYNSGHKATAQTLVGSGVQERFLGWPGNVPNFDFTVTAPVTYPVNFQQYVQITSGSNPAAAGSMTIIPSSADGYYATGTALHLTATANTGYSFNRFHNQPLGQNPLDFTPADVPVDLTAEFNPAGTYTVSTSLGANGSETIDGAVTQGPAVVQWPINSTHNVSVPATLTPTSGVRYVFTQWSDGVTTASRSIAASSVTLYTAQYQQQFQVSLQSSPSTGGTTTGGGWFNAGASATLTATAANGFTFTGFSGDVYSTQTPYTFPVNQPANVAGNFAPSALPVLTASAGAHTNNSPTDTLLTVVLSNTGQGAAVNANIDSITAVVQNGTGTITPPAVLPSPATLAPGQSTSFSLDFGWPSTAARVAFTVNFSANGGAYKGKAVFYVVR